MTEPRNVEYECESLTNLNQPIIVKLVADGRFVVRTELIRTPRQNRRGAVGRQLGDCCATGAKFPGVIVTVMVAMFELTVPSCALNWNLSVPVASGSQCRRTRARRTVDRRHALRAVRDDDEA